MKAEESIDKNVLKAAIKLLLKMERNSKLSAIYKKMNMFIDQHYNGSSLDRSNFRSFMVQCVSKEEKIAFRRQASTIVDFAN